mgnify:CR=1 FL=1
MKYLMSFIINLDKDTCGSDIIEALEYLKQRKDIVFAISTSNPYYDEIIKRYKIEIVKREDKGGSEVIYFKILSSG